MFKRPEEPFKVLKIHGSYTIYLDVYLVGHRIKKSTGIECLPEQFNREDQVVRKNHQDRALANKLLRGYLDRLEFIYLNIDGVKYKHELEDLWNYTKPIDHGPALLDYILQRADIKGAYSPKLANQYKGIHRRWEEFMPKTIYLEDIKKRHLVQFQEYLQSRIITRGGEQYKPDGWSYLNGLKAILAHAVHEDLIQRSPFEGFRFKRVKKDLPWHTPPTHEQIIKLISHEWQSPTQQRVSDYVKLMYFCQGIEPTDFFLLRAQDLTIDFSKNDKGEDTYTFFFTQRRSKGRHWRKTNTYLIPDHCLTTVLKYNSACKRPEQFMFESQNRPTLEAQDYDFSAKLKQQIADSYKRLTQRYLKPMAEELGFNKNQWNFKNLKKAFTNYAGYLLQDSESLRALMGHEDVSITLNHYLTDRERIELIQKIKSYEKLRANELEQLKD